MLNEKSHVDLHTHRRNDKSEYQECTCRMDKNLKGGMCMKFESRKICIAGNQCDNSGFNNLKLKGSHTSFVTTVMAVTILLMLSTLLNKVTVDVLVFVLRVVFFHVML